MEMLRYEPHAGARALRGRKTNVIALAVQLHGESDVADTVPYLDALLEEARSRDYDVVLLTHHEGAAGLRRLARRSICDAFVLMDIAAHDDRARVAAELDLPVVMMGQPAQRYGLDAVDFNARRAGEMLAQSLVESGHRHIVAVEEHGVIASGEYRFYEDFFDGAGEVASVHGVDFDRIPVERDGLAGIRQASSRLLRHRDDRLGIIGRAPNSVTNIMQLLEAEGIVPGEDVSVAGLLTDFVAQRYERPVTNVSPLPKDQSALAMEILFRRLGGDDSPGELHFIQPNPTTERETTRRF